MAPPNTSRPKGLRSLQSGQPLDPIPKLGTYASVIRPYLHDRTPIPAKYRPLREKRLRLVRIRMLRASTSVRQNESRRGILTSSMALAAWKRGRGGVVECTTSPVTTAPASQPATPLPSRSRIEREKPSGEKCKPSGLQHRFLPPRPLTEAWDHRRSRLAQRHERSPVQEEPTPIMREFPLLVRRCPPLRTPVQRGRRRNHRAFGHRDGTVVLNDDAARLALAEQLRQREVQGERGHAGGAARHRALSDRSLLPLRGRCAGLAVAARVP